MFNLGKIPVVFTTQVDQQTIFCKFQISLVSPERFIFWHQCVCDQSDLLSVLSPRVPSHIKMGKRETTINEETTCLAALARRGLLVYARTMQIFDGIISDRGSKYAVSGGPCGSEADAKAFLKHLKKTKKFAKATHNTWGLLLESTPIKNDDGESGAGNVILRMLEREGLQYHIVVVTRWYGGKHLGGDRFRHVQSAVRHYLDNARI